MIVPSPRLILFAGAAVLPALAVGVAAPSAVPFAVAAAVVVIALLDAALARRTFRGIGAELPALVRLSEGRGGAIDLRLTSDGMTARRLALGLALPPELSSPRDTLRAELPAGCQASRVSWPVTPLKKGRYRIDGCFLEAPSPLGFWSVRREAPARADVRVYPDLLAERRHVGALFLNRGPLGIHPRRQVGKGRDFEKLRDYAPGDGYDDIHWKATAKRGCPVTKVYQVERTQEVYAVVDASRLSARSAGADGKTVMARFVSAAMILSMAAERQGDLFGLVTFSDRVHAFLRAGSGKAHATACLEALYTLEPRVVSPDFDELSVAIRHRVRRRALLVFLTSLDDPLLAEGFVRGMDAVCRRHLVLAGMVRPPGARPLFSGPPAPTLDDLYRGLGGHVRWHTLRELGKVLQRRGAMLVPFDDETMCADLVSRYLDIKKRQIL